MTMTTGGAMREWRPFYFINDSSHPVEVRVGDPLFKIVAASTYLIYGLIGGSRGKTNPASAR